ncbi:MAG: hypothetical protein ACJ77A_13900 [Actinomycetota bacterium]
MRRGLVAAAAMAALVLAGCGNPTTGPPSSPTCDHGDVLTLIAQAVPSSTLVPCISEFPAGWTFGGEHVESGHSEFWLDSDRAGFRAITVDLDRTCDTAGAVRVPVEPDEAGTVRLERPRILPPRFTGERFYTFPGGCVTYRFAFRPGATFTQALEATQALTFFSRATGVRVLGRLGLKLCGAGVDCPG